MGRLTPGLAPCEDGCVSVSVGLERGVFDSISSLGSEDQSEGEAIKNCRE